MQRPRSALALVTLALVAAVAACAEPSGMMVEPTGYAASCDDVAAAPLKLANYNIKSGLWSSLDDVAAVVESLDADVIALQEVDNGLERSGGVDQSAELAARIGAERIFAGAWEKDGGSYGIALLSRVPLLQAERFDLPQANGFEPRVGIDAEVCAGGQPLRVVASHADFLPWSAQEHAEALAERVAGDDDVAVVGDFNLPPENESLASFIRGGLADVLAAFTDEPTFADDRIDYVFTDRTVSDADVVASEASDHRPIWARIAPRAE